MKHLIITCDWGSPNEALGACKEQEHAQQRHAWHDHTQDRDNAPAGHGNQIGARPGEEMPADARGEEN